MSPSTQTSTKSRADKTKSIVFICEDCYSIYSVVLYIMPPYSLPGGGAGKASPALLLALPQLLWLTLFVIFPGPFQVLLVFF